MPSIDETKCVLRTKDESSCTNSGTLSFLRVHIESYTAVVQKKPVSLKDALHNKLKIYNLRIDKCVAFVRETNAKIDWNTDVDKILSDSIAVVQITDETLHNFSKIFLFTRDKKVALTRSCDACKKRILINSYVCKKCNYSICHRNECKLVSEKVVCIPRKLHKLVSSLSSTFKIGKKDLITNGDDPKTQTISEQILPVTEIKPCLSYRMRSASDSELRTSFADGHQPQTSTSNVNENNIPKQETLANVILRRSKKRDSSIRWDSLISCEIPYNRIKVDTKNKIGVGSFGIVHKGQDFFHGIVAIKFLNVQNPSKDQINSFRNEMAILKSTRHDNVLLFIGCILKPYLAIVTEWCPGSSLYRHIHVEEEYLKMSELVDIAKQISTGMEYLHALNILHRDLKSNNIFLIPKETNDLKLNNYYLMNANESSGKWKIKIGDFGLATVNSTCKKTNHPSGSILWMAPEVITQKVSDPYSPKSDVYSFAVVLYEMVTGHLPFLKKEQNMILFLVGSGRLKLVPDDARQDTPEELINLIIVCSKYDRNERLDFVEINAQLEKIKIVEPTPKLKRTTSLPNMRFKSYTSYLSNFVLKDTKAFTEIDLLNDSSFYYSLDTELITDY